MMAHSSAADHLERRKQVHLCLRPDLIVESQKYEGRTCYVVKDPVALRYYRFQERERFLMRFLDGRHTLDEARQEYERRYRPERLRLEEVESFAHLLLSCGLAHGDGPETGPRLFARRSRENRARLLRTLTDILYIRMPLFDPDRLLGGLLRPLGWMFTPAFLLAGVGLMLAALLLVAMRFDTFCARLPSWNEFLAWGTIGYLWLALGLVKAAHEFGHGLTCKAQGGAVHEMGALLLCFAPCLYCDVTDAWMLPGKRQRILISAAGIYVELLIAALATFIWWHADGQPFVSQLCLGVIVVCGVHTVLVNANPLLRYDGYYVLADWLEVPNLRERAGRVLENVILGHGLGVEVRPEPFVTTGRRLLLAAYGLASVVYRWLLTCGVTWFLYRFLERQGLGALGMVPALAALGPLVAWPLWRFGRRLRAGGRLPAMKIRNVLCSGAVLGTLGCLFGWMPLPVGNVAGTALVELQPGAADKVYVPAPAFLDRLYVHDGQRVRAGDVLAEFRSLAAEDQREEARCAYDIGTVRLQGLQERTDGSDDPRQRGLSEIERTVIAGERDLALRRMEVYSEQIGRLTLRAPRAGVVMNPPRPDEVGKFWHKDGEAPFCSIGEPGRLRALLPVTPADYRLLQEVTEASGPDVTVRVQGTGTRRLRGRLAPLPEAEVRDLPLALTNRGGGPVPAEVGADGNTLVPVMQHYLAVVDLLETDAGVFPGALGRVVIGGRWHSGAWWLGRALAGAVH
jgi:putative peptide zinc metalloprotease protein